MFTKDHLTVVNEQSALIDALPYFDKGYDDPGVRESAMELIKEQMTRMKESDYLSPAAKVGFLTPLMENEFHRMESRMPMEILSTKRYQLPAPVPGKLNDISAWMDCINNSKSQLQHQRLRLMNLENISDHGTDVWKHFLAKMEEDIKILENSLKQARKETQEINWERRNEQSNVGDELNALEEQWVNLVTNNYELEKLNQELDSKTKEMKSYMSKMHQEMQLSG